MHFHLPLLIRFPPTLSKLPPCGIKENAALLILKHHMELVDEHMGALAPFPVECDAVEDRIGCLLYTSPTLLPPCQSTVMEEVNCTCKFTIRSTSLIKCLNNLYTIYILNQLSLIHI